jgi:preprotein translocase subunit YajC
MFGSATGPGGMGAIQQFIPLILMFAIFYFLLIRPQQKKAKEHRALLDNIKHNAEYLLIEVGDLLKRDFGCETEVIKKRTYTRFAEPHIIESLKKFDGVVTAVGD